MMNTEARQDRHALDRADDVDYRMSFLGTRVVVGVVGVLLPPALVGGDRLIFQAAAQTSLSAYYYTPMRNWFVGSLWAIGCGLLIYFAARRSVPDMIISFVAGLLAISVSLCPTNPPDGDPTALSTAHLVCAGGLFALLGVMSILFGRRDGRRAERTLRWRRIWRIIHCVCGAVILVAVLCVGIISLRPGDSPLTLYAEIVAVAAFGLSWFLKGSEVFNMLRESRGKPALLRAPNL